MDSRTSILLSLGAGLFAPRVLGILQTLSEDEKLSG